MKDATTNQPTRLSADERRAAILEAAVREFAHNGYVGGSTEAISRAVGISQPYLFKLFGTKKQLFLAAYDQVWDAAEQAMAAAFRQHPVDPLTTMRATFHDLATRREMMLLTLQAYAAAGDPAIHAAIRERELAIFNEALQITGATPAEMRRVFADGLLMIVGIALDIPEYLT